MVKNELRQRRKAESLQRGKLAKERSRTADGSSSCLRRFLTACLIIVGLLVAVLTYAYVTSPIRSVVVDVHDPAGMKWNREFNSNLQKGKKILTELKGPESIAVDEHGNWYTGLSDGRLIKISNAGKSRIVIDITSKVNYTANGGRSLKRPLGMRIFKGKLYFADTYQGLFAMDLKTLSWEKIVGFDELSPPLHYTNDLTISKDGVIYFTDVTARWTFQDTTYGVMEGRCTGRLFKIELNGKGLQLLKDNLCFPNGIELTLDETRILLSVHLRHRILVIDINTLSTVKTILLHNGGDNIRRSATHGYWVPIPMLGHPIELFLNRYPFVRDILMKFIRIDDPTSIPNVQQGTILRLNEDLEIEDIHQDLQGKVAQGISHVEEYQPGKFLLGSFATAGIVKLDLPTPQDNVH